MYEVLFGLQGTVYEGRDKKEAFRIYRRAVRLAQRSPDQETVTMFKNGDPIREYDPSLSVVEVS